MSSATWIFIKIVSVPCRCTCISLGSTKHYYMASLRKKEVWIIPILEFQCTYILTNKPGKKISKSCIKSYANTIGIRLMREKSVNLMHPHSLMILSLIHLILIWLFESTKYTVTTLVQHTQSILEGIVWKCF